MGMRDSQNIFATAQDVHATGTSTDGDYYLDTLALTDHAGTSLNDRLGVGGRIAFHAAVANTSSDTAWAGNTAIVVIGLYGHTSSSSITSAGVLLGSITVTIGSTGIAKGTELGSFILPPSPTNRYLLPKVTVSNAAMTAGTIDMWLSDIGQQGH
jgi:hypothetical protein